VIGTITSVGVPASVNQGNTKPIVVQVTDAFGNPLGGQTVAFKPSSGSVAPVLRLTGRRRSDQGSLETRPLVKGARPDRHRSRHRPDADACAPHSTLTHPRIGAKFC
jgi:hypothetical protein